MKLSSAIGECTKIASTSPAAPRRIAWPVPTTSNLMFKPVSDLIWGSNISLKPELLNDVVTASLTLSENDVVAQKKGKVISSSLKSFIIRLSRQL
jgi:hypothetical protein